MKNNITIGNTVLCMIRSMLLLCVIGTMFALPSSAQEPPKQSQPGYSEDVPGEVEFSTFDTLEEAKNLTLRLEESGYKPTIKIDADEKGKPVYRVLVVLGKGESLVPFELPDTSEAGKADWSLLGKKGSLLHGSLTLTGLYTDNAFNTRNDKKSNFTTILSPEIWLAAPRINQKTAPTGFSPRAAGGLALSQPMEEVFRTFQTFLYYRTDIPLYSSNNYSPYGSSSAHTLGAGFMFNGTRFSFRVNDQYEHSYQEREAVMIINPSNQDRYNANRFSVGASYDTLNRLRLNIEYSNFMTRYQSQLSDAKNRIDNNITATVYYRLSPKVDLLAEYQFYNISYDQGSTLDSREHYLYAGFQWNITAKTKGIIKLGYSDKNFRDVSDSSGSFSYEGQIDYRFTPKTSMTVSAYQRTNETNVSGTAFSLASGARIRLQHMLTPKITTGLLLAYTRDRYEGTPEDPTQGSSVRDTIYQAGIDFQYAFKRWLKTRAGYLYTTKYSNVSSFEYKTNMFYFMITGSI